MKPENKEILFKGFDSAWQAVAGDVLVDEVGNYNERISVSREEVIDIVMDAALDTYGKPYNIGVVKWKEVLEEFRKLDYYEQKNLAKEHFTYSSYGSWLWN